MPYAHISTARGWLAPFGAFAPPEGQKLSDEKLRQVVESEGRAVLAWQD
jgi:hypothetical protein